MHFASRWSRGNPAFLRRLNQSGGKEHEAAISGINRLRRGRCAAFGGWRREAGGPNTSAGPGQILNTSPAAAPFSAVVVTVPAIPAPPANSPAAGPSPGAGYVSRDITTGRARVMSGRRGAGRGCRGRAQPGSRRTGACQWRLCVGTWGVKVNRAGARAAGLFH
jgi:hypothetical protein